MEKVLAMHQSGFDVSAFPNRGGAVHSGALRAPKITMYGPVRYALDSLSVISW